MDRRESVDENLALLLGKRIFDYLKDDYQRSGKISSSMLKNLWNNKLKSYSYPKEISEVIKSHVDSIAKSSSCHVVFDKTLQTASPLVCGLGATHIFETSITLHHIWGVPYIPGSSLKGVCRQVVFWKLVEVGKLSKDNLKDSQEKFYGDLNTDDKEILKYQLLFGTQGFKGLLLFLDAYPEIPEGSMGKLFRLDIMNPHYSEYYGEKRDIPGDWENPVPVFFLTVKEGVSFRFVVLFDECRWEVIKKKGIPDKEGKRRQLADEEIKGVEEYMESEKFYEDIIGQALEFYGVGSKTRLGYGLFER
ncbi:MAG: type III-B CRISPR module RAMP protein Cmr6 [Aquificota bacterium]|nr:MAG: type III-B CRISPR module RAMP protein Cmr6 [Aquificota bacterium]